MASARTNTHFLPPGKQYHVFFMFDLETQADKVWVSTVRQSLENEGYLCVDEEMDVPPGHSKNQALQQFLDLSLVVVLSMSVHSKLSDEFTRKLDNVYSWYNVDVNWNSTTIVPVRLDCHVSTPQLGVKGVRVLEGYGPGWTSRIVERIKKVVEHECNRYENGNIHFIRPYNNSIVKNVCNYCCQPSLLKQNGIFIKNHTVCIHWDVFDEALVLNNHMISEIAKLCKPFRIMNFKILLSPQSKPRFHKRKATWHRKLLHFFEEALDLDLNGQFDRSTFRHRLSGDLGPLERSSLISISQRIYQQEFRSRSEDYRSLESRLGTYVDAPDSVKEQQDILAKAGFIYTGSGEFFVLCPWCNTARFKYGKQEDEEIDLESLLRYHKKWSQNCRYLEELDFENVSEEGITLTEDIDRVLGIAVEDYESVYKDVLEYNEMRLKDVDSEISAEELTDMGFLFRFTAPDPYQMSVICYSCQVTLWEFHTSRELLLQHVKWSQGKCKHLLHSAEDVDKLYREIVSVSEQSICGEFVVEIMLVKRYASIEENRRNVAHRLNSNKKEADAFTDTYEKTRMPCPGTGSGKTARQQEDSYCSACRQLRSNIVNLAPPTTLNIVLIGPVSAGKSSYINSVSSVFKERLCTKAPVGYTIDGLTEKLTKYRVSNSGVPLAFNLWDTSGFRKSRSSHKECSQGLYRFENQGVDGPWMKNWATQEISGMVHSVGFVLDASKFYELTEEIKIEIQKQNLLAKKQGYQPVFILTHIDKVNSSQNTDNADLATSEQVYDLKKRVESTFGSPFNLVYPIKNYEHESCLDDKINLLLIESLQKLLLTGEDFIEQHMESLQGTPV